jgi:hypothetical protein
MKLCLTFGERWEPPHSKFLEGPGVAWTPNVRRIVFLFISGYACGKCLQ